MTQLLEYARGHRVESPEALVSVIASRAAIKARDDWERRRGYLQLPENANAGADEDGDGNRGRDSDFIALVKNHSETLRIESMRAMAAIAQLKPLDRDIAELTFLEEWKPAEVAAKLGRPVETVRNRLVAIRKILRQSLESQAPL